MERVWRYQIRQSSWLCPLAPASVHMKSSACSGRAEWAKGIGPRHEAQSPGRHKGLAGGVMDPRRAPARVRLRHRANQGPHVGHVMPLDAAICGLWFSRLRLQTHAPGLLVVNMGRLRRFDTSRVDRCQSGRSALRTRRIASCSPSVVVVTAPESRGVCSRPREAPKRATRPSCRRPCRA